MKKLRAINRNGPQVQDRTYKDNWPERQQSSANGGFILRAVLFWAEKVAIQRGRRGRVHQESEGQGVAVGMQTLRDGVVGCRHRRATRSTFVMPSGAKWTGERTFQMGVAVYTALRGNDQMGVLMGDVGRACWAKECMRFQGVDKLA
jgi:hypothetical protein